MIKNCIICNRELKISPSKYAIGRGRFCSRKCFIIHKRQATYKEITCLTCNKKFQLPQSKMKGSRGKFCSRKCFHIWHKVIISDILKGRKYNGTVWNKGKKLPPISEWHKKQISNAVSGSKNPSWKGGISFEPYPLGWTKTFKEQIRYRDGYTCQKCGVPEIECNRKLHVHHIDYNKNNLKLNNLVSLCCSCHGKTQINRKYWEQYFKERNVLCELKK